MNWLSPFDIGLVMGLLFAFAVVSFGLSFRLLNFPDLTIEGTIPLSAALYARMLQSGAQLPEAVVVAVLGGGIAGGLTGFLHTRFKINKFLAGIIVIAIAYSLSLRIMQGSNIGLIQKPSPFDIVAPIDSLWSGLFQTGKLAFLGILMLSVIALVLYGLSTRVGLRMRTAGSNPEFARSLGINVSANLVVGLSLTNALAALTGVLLAGYQGFSDVNMGTGTLLLALAALTVGEKIVSLRLLSFPIYVVTAAIIGSLVYQIVVAYAIRLGLAPSDLKLITAVMVLIVVAVRFSRNGELLTEGVQ